MDCVQLKWIAFELSACVRVKAPGGVGGVMSGGGPIDRGTDLVLVVGGGLDRLWSRKRSAGLEMRIASFGGDVTVVTIGLRGTTRWDFF